MTTYNNYRGTFYNWEIVPDGTSSNINKYKKDSKGSYIPQNGDYIIVIDVKDYPNQLWRINESGIPSYSEDIIGRKVAQDVCNGTTKVISKDSFVTYEDYFNIRDMKIIYIKVYEDISWRFIYDGEWDPQPLVSGKAYAIGDIVRSGTDSDRYLQYQKQSDGKCGWVTLTDYEPGKARWRPSEVASPDESSDVLVNDSQMRKNTANVMRVLENKSTLYWGSKELHQGAIDRIKPGDEYEVVNETLGTCHEGDTLWLNVKNLDTEQFGQLYLTALENCKPEDEKVNTRVISWVWSGKQGSKWYTGSGEPSSQSVPGAVVGDYYLNKDNGDVFVLEQDGWRKTTCIRGDDGVSFDDVIEHYLASKLSEGVTRETEGWDKTTTMSFELKYLWNYKTIKKYQGEVEVETETDPRIVGTYKDKGIDKVTQYYALSVDENTKPKSGDWSTAVPTMTSENKALWNYTHTLYTDKTSDNTEPAVIGRYGDAGKTAYQIAVEHGYKGTEEEWLKSLKGSDGDKWYNSEGEPGPSVGKEGDWCVDTTTGNVYHKTKEEGETVATWKWDGNITGNDGDKWFNGEIDPTEEYPVDAKEDDYYLNSTTGDVFKYVLDEILPEPKYSWVKQGNIKGPIGEKGADGKSQYIHMAYAKNDDKSDFHKAPVKDDDRYMGTCVTETEDFPTSASSFEWSTINAKDAANFNIRGEWQQDTEYVRDDKRIDMVYVDDPSYTKGTYVCTVTHTSGKIFEPTCWSLMTADGNDSIIVVLSNENSIVPCRNDGTSPDLSRANTTVSLYKGGVIQEITAKVYNVPVGIEYKQEGNTFSITKMDDTSDTSYLDLGAKFAKFEGDEGEDYMRRYVITKQKAAKDGDDAVSYWVDKSVSIISRNPNTSQVDPSSVTFTAMMKKGSGLATPFDGVIDFYKNGATSPTKTATRTLTHSLTYGDNDKYYTVKLYADENRTSVLDTETVQILEVGKDGVSMRNKGKWTPNTDYVNNDKFIDHVFYEPLGSSYSCKESHTSSSEFDVSKWNEVASKGGKGADGVSQYIHVAYAKNDDKSDVHQVYDSANDKYMGTYVDENKEWPSEPKTIPWSWSTINHNGKSFKSEGEWKSGVMYYGDITNPSESYISMVYNDVKKATYTCKVTHTSGDFDEDMDKGYWSKLTQDGSVGTSVVWKGSFPEAPSNPENLWAYYNTTDKKSYIYNGTTKKWEQMTKDGDDATQMYYHVVYCKDRYTGEGYSTDPRDDSCYTGSYTDDEMEDAPTWAEAEAKGVKWNYTKGESGDDGRSLTKEDMYYINNDDGVNKPKSSEFPLKPNDYIVPTASKRFTWCKEVRTFSKEPVSEEHIYLASSYGEKGDKGNDAVSFSLSANSYIFKSGVSSTITFTAKPVNLEGTISWSTSPSGIGGKTSDTTYKITSDQMGSNETVTVTASMTVDGTTYSDSQTVKVLSDGEDGVSAVNVICNNPAVNIPTDNNGKPLSSMTFSASFFAYKGTSSSTCTIGTITDKPDWITYTVSGDTVTFTVDGTKTISSNSSITVPVTAEGLTFNEKISLSISKQGNKGDTGDKGEKGDKGDDSTSYWIEKSCNVVVKDSDSGSLNPTSITFTARKQTGTSTPSVFTSGVIKVYKNSKSGDPVGTSTSGVVTVTVSSDAEVYYAVLYQSSESGASELDTETVSVVKTGKKGNQGDKGGDAMTAILTNDSAQIPTDSSGTPVSGVTWPSTTIELYKGGTKVTSGLTYSHTVSGCTVDSTTSSTVTLKSITADSASVTMNVTYDTKTYSKVFTVTKQKQGNKGDKGNDSVSLSLSADSYIFKSGVSSTITFTPKLQNLSGTVTWKTSPANIGKESSGKYLITSSDMGTNTSVTVTATCGSYSDSNTVKVVSDGVNYWVSQGWVDVSDTSVYSENKWYPVIGDTLSSNGPQNIKVSVQLNSGKKPSWSTHSSGFSVDFEVQDQRNGWGTTDAYCLIYIDNYKFVSNGGSPVSYTQMTYPSIPVIYMRGGGKYYVSTTYSCTWTPKPNGYTWQSGSYSQSVMPSDTRPTPRGTSVQGKDGKSVTISSKEVKYQNSTSGSTVPTGEWNTSPSPVSGKYMWTRTIVKYSDSNETVSYSVSYCGNNGSPGTPARVFRVYSPYNSFKRNLRLNGNQTIVVYVDMQGVSGTCSITAKGKAGSTEVTCTVTTVTTNQEYNVAVPYTNSFDSVEITGTLTGCSDQKLTLALNDVTETDINIGLINANPSASVYGYDKFKTGDYFTASDNFGTYLKGVPYMYNGTTWDPMPIDNVDNAPKALNSLQQIVNTGLDINNAPFYGWFQNLIAQNAIIKNLISTTITMGENGIIQSKNYKEDSSTHIPTQGFKLTSNDGVIKSVKMEAYELTAVNSSFEGHIEANHFKTKDKQTPSAAVTYTIPNSDYHVDYANVGNGWKTSTIAANSYQRIGRGTYSTMGITITVEIYGYVAAAVTAYKGLAYGGVVVPYLYTTKYSSGSDVYKFVYDGSLGECSWTTCYTEVKSMIDKKSGYSLSWDSTSYGDYLSIPRNYTVSSNVVTYTSASCSTTIGGVSYTKDTYKKCHLTNGFLSALPLDVGTMGDASSGSAVIDGTSYSAPFKIIKSADAVLFTKGSTQTSVTTSGWYSGMSITNLVLAAGLDGVITGDIEPESANNNIGLVTPFHTIKGVTIQGTEVWGAVFN